MVSRQHHYLSQCYLKGFTKGGSKKSKLTVIDVKEKKCFETNPRNVGGIRDFNRIEMNGIALDSLEKNLAKFENEAASALRQIEKDLRFEGKTKDLILNLIALLAFRSPERREHWRKFEEEIAKITMNLLLENKERWDAQIRKIKESGKKVNDNVTYEDMKRFHENKEYKIEVPQEQHIINEFKLIDDILPYIYNRNWILVRSNEDSGPFITSDNPVNLMWKRPENIPLIYRNSPGYGAKDAFLYFPISKNLALIGEFDGPKGIIDGTKEFVAILNTNLLIFVYKQLYAPKINFFFIGEKGDILSGKQIIKHIDA